MRALITAGLLFGCTLCNAAEPAFEAQAQALIGPFAQALMGTVKQALSEGGPKSAILACQTLAPDIASEHSQAPWTVGRTALKLRNPDNRPDAWERQVLEDFATAAAKGQPLADLKRGEVVGSEYRYMQAIATGEPCLACHGQAIAPDVAALIDRQYPNDQARGFALGDLRGAFTLRRPLNENTP
ncbi:MAG TPA: DUF3365 domain-containing protein [Pseudomonas sp.]|nr:DUF3365 domain-containing protein [Pseudomonas sp.]